MTYQIAFGTDTETIEDPDQLVLLSLPDTCADLDGDDLIDYINAYYGSADVSVEPLVGLNDVLDSLRLALSAHSISPGDTESIIATLTDALDNNL